MNQEAQGVVSVKAAQEWLKFEALFRQECSRLEVVTIPSEVAKKIFKENEFAHIGKKKSHTSASSWPQLARQRLGKFILEHPKLQITEKQKYYINEALTKNPRSTVRVIDGVRGWKRKGLPRPPERREKNGFAKPISIETKSSSPHFPILKRESKNIVRKPTDSVKSFVEKHLVVNQSEKVSVEEVYARYTEFCRDHDYAPTPITAFKLRATQYGFTVNSSLSMRFYRASLINFISDEEKKKLDWDPTLDNVRKETLRIFHRSVRAELNLGKISDEINLPAALFEEACRQSGMVIPATSSPLQYVNDVKPWMVRLLPEAVDPVYHVLVLETERRVVILDDAQRIKRHVKSTTPVNFDENGQMLLPLEEPNLVAMKKNSKRRKMNKKVASKTFKNRGGKTIPQRLQTKRG